MAQSLPPTTGDLRTFGAFHFDPARGELFQHGDKQKLTQQPARVLERLTATPRLIVRREELARVLWPSDPPANPSAGINNAILTLRRLFGDDAENPTYIRSVAGEGYVFLLPVARGQLNGHSHAGGHAGVANADGQSGDAAPVTVQTAGSRVATDAGASTISPRRSSQLFVTLVRSSLATLAVVMLSIALFTPAVGIDAAAFALLFAALIVFWEDVPDSVLTRATVSLVLLAGMAYVPSAWTLYELSGHVINFDALGPASLYWLPVAVHAVQFAATFVLARRHDARHPDRRGRDDLDVDPRLGERLEDRRCDPRVGLHPCADDGDLGLGAVVGDPRDDGFLHAWHLLVFLESDESDCSATNLLRNDQTGCPSKKTECDEDNPCAFGSVCVEGVCEAQSCATSIEWARVFWLAESR